MGGNKALDVWGGRVLLGMERRLGRKSPEQVDAYGERLGKILRMFSGKRFQVALENLARALPELSESERTRIARASYVHFGRVTADFLASRERSFADQEMSCQMYGWHYAEEALALGKGFLFASGHLGHFERVAPNIVGRGVPMSVVIRDADTPGVNQLVNDIRRSCGATVIPRGDAGRPMLMALRQNHCVGILSDQNHDGEYIPFFGHPAGTNVGLGVIHERTGAPVLPGVVWWNSPGQYEFHLAPPLLTVAGQPKGVGTMMEFHTWLESRIRERPEQWLWFHDRWRSAKRRGLVE